MSIELNPTKSCLSSSRFGTLSSCAVLVAILTLLAANQVLAQSKKSNNVKLELKEEVKVAKVVYDTLREHEIFSKLLVFGSGGTVKAVEQAQIFFRPDTETYQIFLIDRESKKGGEAPIMKAESTEQIMVGKKAWIYEWCSCGGLAMLPGTNFSLEHAQESGDYCHFARENGKRTNKCVGRCDGKCEKGGVGADGQGNQYKW